MTSCISAEGGEVENFEKLRICISSASDRLVHDQATTPCMHNPTTLPITALTTPRATTPNIARQSHGGAAGPWGRRRRRLQFGGASSSLHAASERRQPPHRRRWRWWWELHGRSRAIASTTTTSAAAESAQFEAASARTCSPISN